ncbi:hypothetical protein DFP72DRAFT_58244 [Ephemerocybe angulata]|uniref:Uncharacterized protein n=1 Tax=Ephemerocybe angulata TaxID=980116 RepID=A0A8H6I9G8_9AGAR|nr:hypothetical protein DFP72DRAFT_58244 [Tulosesus angulatus]
MRGERVQKYRDLCACARSSLLCSFSPPTLDPRYHPVSKYLSIDARSSNTPVRRSLRRRSIPSRVRPPNSGIQAPPIRRSILAFYTQNPPSTGPSCARTIHLHFLLSSARLGRGAVVQILGGEGGIIFRSARGSWSRVWTRGRRIRWYGVWSGVCRACSGTYRSLWSEGVGGGVRCDEGWRLGALCWSRPARRRPARLTLDLRCWASKRPQLSSLPHSFWFTIFTLRPSPPPPILCLPLRAKNSGGSAGGGSRRWMGEDE